MSFDENIQKSHSWGVFYLYNIIWYLTDETFNVRGKRTLRVPHPFGTWLSRTPLGVLKRGEHGRVPVRGITTCFELGPNQTLENRGKVATSHRARLVRVRNADRPEGETRNQLIELTVLFSYIHQSRLPWSEYSTTTENNETSRLTPSVRVAVDGF